MSAHTSEEAWMRTSHSWVLKSGKITDTGRAWVCYGLQICLS